MPALKRTRPARQIAEVPGDERPRERLLRNGAQSLSDAELLAVVLKNGLAWGSALDLTRDLLADTGGLAGLTVASALTLQRQGVGDVQLAALLAAVELACRMAEARMPDRQILSRPTSVAVRLCRIQHPPSPSANVRSEAGVFPIDAVFAVIEIKSCLTASSLRDAYTNAAS